jgi:hypothetical protein
LVFSRIASFLVGRGPPARSSSRLALRENPGAGRVHLGVRPTWS